MAYISAFTGGTVASKKAFFLHQGGTTEKVVPRENMSDDNFNVHVDCTLDTHFTRLRLTHWYIVPWKRGKVLVRMPLVRVANLAPHTAPSPEKYNRSSGKANRSIELYLRLYRSTQLIPVHQNNVTILYMLYTTITVHQNHHGLFSRNISLTQSPRCWNGM